MITKSGFLSSALDNVGAKMSKWLYFPEKNDRHEYPSPKTKCVSAHPMDADFLSIRALSSMHWTDLCVAPALSDWTEHVEGRLRRRGALGGRWTGGGRVYTADRRRRAGRAPLTTGHHWLRPVSAPRRVHTSSGQTHTQHITNMIFIESCKCKKKQSSKKTAIGDVVAFY